MRWLLVLAMVSCGVPLEHERPSLVGTWLIQIGSNCAGSMKLEPGRVPSGIYGCARDGYSAPTYQGTVRLEPDVDGGASLVFTSRHFTEAQEMRGELGADGVLVGTFGNRGDAPAMGASFSATRE